MKTPKHAPVTSINPEFARKPLAYLVSSLALVSCLSATQAVAQTAPASSSTVSTDEIQVVDVIGTRQAEENAINRKKKAKTAMDSIVAEDVGKMPDSNVGEAISRIAGVSLDRGDSGEGVGISIRGQSPDLTRIEVDGQAMMSGGGASSGMNGTIADAARATNGEITGGPSGRAQGVRDLPADLIKSVDVIKGSTADMNEGSLGGGVQIKTRNALDFKKRYSSVKLQTTQGSINTEMSPAYTVVLADQFMDGRLGILFNASGSKITNEGHVASNTDSGRGYDHLVDFDNSPEKTYSFNPNTLSTSAVTATNTNYATTPLFSAPLTAGGNMDFETPLSFLTKAGNAATKADCYTAFPALTTVQTNAISGTANQANARGQRSNELIGCLNQWNDWTPQNLRYQVKRDYEDRKNLDLRVDFKVNDDLIVYAKGSQSSRDILNTFETYTLGGLLSINPNATTHATAPGTYYPGYTGTAFTTAAGATTATPNSGYYTNLNTAAWTNAVQTTGLPIIKNVVTNFLPGSVVVDANHHVTQYSYSNGRSSTDQIDSDQHVDIDYLQLGGTYEKDKLTAEFMLGDARSEFTRNDMRVSWFTDYGAGTTKLVPGGIWQTAPADGSTFDQTNPANYVALRPAASATAARFTNGIGFNQQQPRLAETEEITGKLDVTYKFEGDIPLITQVKAGLNYRNVDTAGWGNGGGTIQAAVGVVGQPGFVPAITLGTNNARGNITGCENTAGSLGAGGVPCAYGFATQPIQSRDVVNVVSQAALQDMIQQSMKAPSATFFNGFSGRNDTFIDGWNQIDVKKFYRLAGAGGHFSLHCMKECLASDGKIYKQPKSQSIEESLAGYIMGDFEYKELPYDMELTGNLGVRVVQTDLAATGFLGFRSIVTTPQFDPLNPALAAGIVDTTIYQATTIDDTTTHTLPSFNLGLWVIPDEVVVRYSYGETVARPAIWQLIPAGTCTYDIRRLLEEVNDEGDAVDMGCGVFGNPKLKAYENTNQNLSLEWYPNKGQMVSVAVFNSKSKIGGGIRKGFADRYLFAGSDARDPATGALLSESQYSGTTWENGPGYDNTGIELSTKSSFTFLPWYFKYTGLDLNYTKLDYSTSLAGQMLDPNSGKKLPPRGLVPESYNVSLWYDDGRVNARVSYQFKDEIFLGMSRGQGNGVNYPIVGNLEDWVRWAPYNPGAPRFTDAAGFIDAKITYKFDKNLEVFFEGRNLGKAASITSTGGYYDFEDGTQNVEEYRYFGRKLTAGLNYKF